jgi:hypothetical protein
VCVCVCVYRCVHANVRKQNGVLFSFLQSVIKGTQLLGGSDKSAIFIRDLLGV